MSEYETIAVTRPVFWEFKKEKLRAEEKIDHAISSTEFLKILLKMYRARPR